ncbi:MAG: hypothetical protein LQ349_002114 [Xanthoria aureola]|nr:MAG: hypothetical protein LQ349_002114 [Xanthoria aureola]
MADPVTTQRISAALNETTPSSQSRYPQLPPIAEDRLRSSLTDQTCPGELPPDPQALEAASKKDQTYLYLAYGSNLASSTFQGVRGIKPLATLNVVVPSLVLTFDLAGFPYTEPCFANTAHRSPSPNPASSEEEKTPLLPDCSDPDWPKGLVGVVYEVTPHDYAHIIATEGGGASYHDVLVTCHPLPPSSATVPQHPDTPPFKAHTLFAPNLPPKEGGSYRRPDPEYAQASRRYLDLLITGAKEHGLPDEYREYLDELQPYTITTRGQRMGRFVLTVTWVPVLRAVFMIGKRFSDEGGRSPPWLVRLLGSVFVGIWATYDLVLKPIFGDGERTIEEKGGETSGKSERRRRRKLVKRRKDGVGEKAGWVDDV